jgi:hypothetical protein
MSERGGILENLGWLSVRSNGLLFLGIAELKSAQIHGIDLWKPKRMCHLEGCLVCSVCWFFNFFLRKPLFCPNSTLTILITFEIKWLVCVAFTERCVRHGHSCEVKCRSRKTNSVIPPAKSLWRLETPLDILFLMYRQLYEGHYWTFPYNTCTRVFIGRQRVPTWSLHHGSKKYVSERCVSSLRSSVH